eukprot:scpid75762/ scgid0997/ 
MSQGNWPRVTSTDQEDHKTPMDWPGQQWQHVPTPHSLPVQTQQQHTQPTEHMMAQSSFTRNPRDAIMSGSSAGNALGETGLDLVYPVQGSFNSMYHSNQLNGCSNRLQGYGEQQSHPTWSSTSQAPTVSQYFADTRNLPAETGDYQTPMDTSRSYYHSPYSFPVKKKGRYTQATVPTTSQSKITRNAHAVSASLDGNASGKTGSDAVGCSAASVIPISHSHQANGSFKHPEGNYREQQSHPPLSSTSQAPVVSDTRTLPTDVRQSVKLERNAKGTDLALRRRRQNNIAAARHRLKKKRIVEGYIQIIERLSAENLELQWTVLHQQKEIADLSAQKLGMHIYPK